VQQNLAPSSYLEPIIPPQHLPILPQSSSQDITDVIETNLCNYLVLLLNFINRGFIFLLIYNIWLKSKYL
jgi:hypothetical protein